MNNVLKDNNGMKEAMEYLNDRYICLIHYKYVNLRITFTTNNNNIKWIYIVLKLIALNLSKLKNNNNNIIIKYKANGNIHLHSHYINCDYEKIEIIEHKELDSGEMTWTALCLGDTYQCSKKNGSVRCTEMASQFPN